jgi:hypothetical protein
MEEWELFGRRCEWTTLGAVRGSGARTAGVHGMLCSGVRAAGWRKARVLKDMKLIRSTIGKGVM